MKIKYFLRGLGFGILITALLLAIGTKKNDNKTISDSEVMKRAKQLGMLTKEEAKDYKMEAVLDNMKDSISEAPSSSKKPEIVVTKEPEKKKQDSEKEDNTNKESSSTKNEKNNERKTITITIEPGMVSQNISRYLYQKNVIGSAKDFNDYMQEHNVAEKLRAGEFEIPVDASYAEIVEILT